MISTDSYSLKSCITNQKVLRSVFVKPRMHCKEKLKVFCSDLSEFDISEKGKELAFNIFDINGNIISISFKLCFEF